MAWVAERDGAIVGHVALAAPSPRESFPAWSEATNLGPERIGVVARFYVAREAHGSGAAARLFDTAVAEACRRDLAPVLDVLTSNARGIAFYERRGWRRVGEATLHLADPPGATLPMLLYVAPA